MFLSIPLLFLKLDEEYNYVFVLEWESGDENIHFAETIYYIYIYFEPSNILPIQNNK